MYEKCLNNSIKQARYRSAEKSKRASQADLQRAFGKNEQDFYHIKAKKPV